MADGLITCHVKHKHSLYPITPIRSLLVRLDLLILQVLLLLLITIRVHRAHRKEHARGNLPPRLLGMVSFIGASVEVEIRLHGPTMRHTPFLLLSALLLLHCDQIQGEQNADRQRDNDADSDAFVEAVPPTRQGAGVGGRARARGRAGAGICAASATGRRGLGGARGNWADVDGRCGYRLAGRCLVATQHHGGHASREGCIAMAVAGAVVTASIKLPAGRVGKNIVLHRSALARNG